LHSIRLLGLAGNGSGNQSGRRGRGLQVSPEFLAKLVQLADIDIANRPEAEAGLGPVTDVKSTTRLADNVPVFGTWRRATNRLIHMMAAAVNDRRCGLAA
jgi:hypothetical protein